jgi:hypothetical protein
MRQKSSQIGNPDWKLCVDVMSVSVSGIPVNAAKRDAVRERCLAINPMHAVTLLPKLCNIGSSATAYLHAKKDRQTKKGEMRIPAGQSLHRACFRTLRIREVTMRLMFICLMACIFAVSTCWDKVAAQMKPPAIEANGYEFLKACKQAEASDSNEFLGGLCFGYIQGVVDGMYAAQSYHHIAVADSLVCLPDETPRVQVLKVVNKYIENHSNHPTEKTFLLVAAALVEAYSCKK